MTTDTRPGDSDTGRSKVVDLWSWPSGVARLGVVAVVALAFLTGASRLRDDALPGQDGWATANASNDYAARTFPEDEYIGSGRVAEEARLWMPRDARYNVLLGEAHIGSPWDWAAPNFFAGFLAPRRRVSTDAEWVICLGCDPEQLAGVEVLSSSENGVVFGRRS